MRAEDANRVPRDRPPPAFEGLAAAVQAWHRARLEEAAGDEETLRADSDGPTTIEG